jgi:uncharacterized membrane protein YciS (DUF1049 family)
MRYRLRTLLIVLAVGLLGAWLIGAIVFTVRVSYTQYPPNHDLRMAIEPE